jgi:hypothetical protein
VTLIPASALADLRAITESSMVDTCTITRRSSTTRVFNATTGAYNDPDPDEIYTGACRVRPLLTGKDTTESAGALVTLRQYAATLPRTTNDIFEGDILTVTASDDGQLIGRPLYVLSVGFLTDNVHRRLMLEDRQLPNIAGS